MVKKTTAEKKELTAEKRKVFGRKLKTLRREDILPANIYGKKVKSLAVQLGLKDFLPIYQLAGETGLVELKVKGEQKIRPVLIHNVQLHPVTDQPLHADFYQVDLKEKVTTEVPLELVGESPAVEQKLGILIQPLTAVEVEALPANLPDKFNLDTSGLKEVDDAVTAGDLETPKGVKILTAAKQVLAKIEPLTKEEEVAPPPEEEKPTEEAEAEEEKPVEGKIVEEKPKEGAKNEPEKNKPPIKEKK